MYGGVRAGDVRVGTLLDRLVLGREPYLVLVEVLSWLTRGKVPRFVGGYSSTATRSDVGVVAQLASMLKASADGLAGSAT